VYSKFVIRFNFQQYHFTEDQYAEPRKDGRRELKEGALPSIFDHLPGPSGRHPSARSVVPMAEEYVSEKVVLDHSYTDPLCEFALQINKKTARMLCFVFFSQAVNYSLYFVPGSKYIIRSLLTTNNNPIMGILWQRTLQPLIINKFETMLLKELLHSRREILTNDLKLERL
jgi:hypothetical protein